MKADAENSKGVMLLLITVLGWGLMYPAAKAATTAGIDGYFLTAIRYGLGCLLVSGILLLTEGAKSFSFENRKKRVWLYGTIGFGGLNFFTFLGVGGSSAEHAAIILALMPIMSIFLSWALDGARPTAVTMVCSALAFVGISLVITKGDLHQLRGVSEMAGDLLLLLATFCWVVYTYFARTMSGWSPLRVTALSSLMGTTSILLLTASLTLAGIAHPPPAGVVASVLPELTIMILTTAVIVTWNGGIKRLGPINGILFVNLVPVVTFMDGFAHGNTISQAEIIGSTITIAALVANNLLSRSVFNGIPAVVKQ